MTARCEPPPHLRDRDGWHVVWTPNGTPGIQSWHTRVGKWGNGLSPDEMDGRDYRYGGPAPEPSAAPVPAPDAVAALCEAGKKAADELCSLLEYGLNRPSTAKCMNALDAALAPFTGEPT